MNNVSYNQSHSNSNSVAVTKCAPDPRLSIYERTQRFLDSNSYILRLQTSRCLSCGEVYAIGHSFGAFCSKSCAEDMAESVFGKGEE
jgi:hypothetical protein